MNGEKALAEQFSFTLYAEEVLGGVKWLSGHKYLSNVGEWVSVLRVS